MKAKHALFVVMSIALLFTACAAIPKGARSVDRFQKERYLGTWYEIARLDFKFERNLDNTTAEYSADARDGTITVINRGYNYVKGTWAEAKGSARFRGPESKGELEVSFFGPFYSAYNIIALDEEYRYALIAGKNLKYLWILSRTKTIPDEIKNEYVSLAGSLGYDIDALIWVKHNQGGEQ